jgi:hypothetical protein
VGLRVLCCGDRNWTDFDKIMSVLSLLPPESVIIHGAARGADTLCGKAGFLLGYQVEAYPADWKQYGKRAGPVRNREMFAKSHPDFYLAFHSSLASSKGTKDMVSVLNLNNVKGMVII